MKRKSILALALVAMLSTSVFISGCGKTSTTNKATTTTEETVDKAGDAIKNGTDKAGEAVKEGAEAVKNGVKKVGEGAKYTAVDLKNDFVKAGHDVKDSANTKKTYFKGTETDYLLGSDVVRVYEYKTPEELNADVKTIGSDGVTLNGKKVDFKTKPYYYINGNSLIVYEGSDPAYVKEFNNNYGSTIIP